MLVKCKQGSWQAAWEPLQCTLAKLSLGQQFLSSNWNKKKRRCHERAEAFCEGTLDDPCVGLPPVG
eukprot:1162040-Pelagomonas_calceolata.AAC.5